MPCFLHGAEHIAKWIGIELLQSLLQEDTPLYAEMQEVAILWLAEMKETP